MEISLEIFFKDSRTLLAVFLDGAHRHDVSQRLQGIITRHSTHEHVSTLGLVLREMSIAMPKGKGRAALTAHEKALATAQRRWQDREISNVGGTGPVLLGSCLTFDGPLVHVSECLEPALGTHAERCDAVSGLSYVVFPCGCVLALA